MKNTFIHIGYPKCASTALQTGFFTPHPELFYLGPYNGGLSFGFHNKEFKRLVEIEWRLMKDFGYDEVHAKSVVKQCYKDFLVSGKRKFGFSFESFAFTMHHDIDVTQKAARLAKIFGRGTKIIMITRNQFDLLKSYYREMIVVGLTASYYKFISDIFYNKFRSIVFDFNFYKMYQLYAGHFGPENVLVLPYEYLKTNSQKFFELLAAHIGVTCNVTGIPHANESQNEAFYEHFRELNSTFRHSLGLAINEPVNQYRYSDYFREVDGIDPPPGADLEQSIHPLLWTNAMEKSRTSSLKIQYEMPMAVGEWLTRYYGKSNQLLASSSGLPLKELGYVVSDSSLIPQ